MNCLRIAFAFASALAVMSAPAEAARLNSRVEVNADVIRVGDLFTGAGAAAELVVGKAPAPGKRRMIEARQLLRIAHDAKLDWRPESRLVSAMVRRASRIVGREEIAGAIRRALADQGVEGDLELTIANRGMRLHVPADQARGFRVANLRHDLTAGRFVAVLETFGPDGPYGSFRVNGRVYTMLALPVLNRRMRPGDVIRAGDIRTMRVRAQRLAHGAVRDIAAIVGQSPRRFLRAGTPIRHGDLRAPVVVPKGSVVTLSLRTPTMTLTAKGRAAEDGARGDTIRVINTRSRRTVEAVVVASGLVMVPLQNNLSVALGGTR